MNNRKFAHQLASWLDPQEIIKCALRYDRDRTAAFSIQTLIFGSGELKSGDEGNFAVLTTSFLKGFHIPEGVLEILTPIKAVSGISDDAWDWLRGLTLNPEIGMTKHGMEPKGVDPRTILFITERDAILDLVRLPLLGLMDLVSHFAYQWKQAIPVSKAGATIYYESKMPSEFYSYVESEVAKYYVTLSTAPSLSGQVGVKSRYRAVTVYGPIKPNDAVWDAAKAGSIAMAQSTHEPI